MKSFQNKSIKIYILVITMLFLAASVIAAAEISLNKKLDVSENGAKAEKIYKKHIAMIGGSSTKDSFWESIYEGACEQGRKYSMYVENFGSGLSSDYSLEELLQMAIAAKVDGIIVRPDGGAKTNERILEAAEKGISVITMLEDNPNSKRLSFVTANDYSMGELYGERVGKLIKAKPLSEGRKGRKIRIAVMVGPKGEESAPNLIYSGIRDYVAKRQAKEEVEWVTVGSLSGGEFASEEAIRDMVLDGRERPDMIVCFNAVDTISAYQCIIDYNLVGKVSIIGYYTSSEILGGIRKGIIDSTIAVDTKEMGRVSVEGLHDYFTKGYVSEYLQVGSSLITRENIGEYMGKDDE